MVGWVLIFLRTADTRRRFHFGCARYDDGGNRRRCLAVSHSRLRPDRKAYCERQPSRTLLTRFQQQPGLSASYRERALRPTPLGCRTSFHL
jgi:hypothetical protein